MKDIGDMIRRCDRIDGLVRAGASLAEVIPGLENCGDLSQPERARRIGQRVQYVQELALQARHELEALRAELAEFGSRPDPIAEALNSGDGTYRP